MVSVMSLFALVLFGYGSALVYHLVPRKARWVVLLAASLAFYVSRNLMGLPFLLATALISWFASLQMDRAASAVKEQIAASPALGRDEKKALRTGAKTRQRRWLLFALLADFAMLAVFKYTNDILGLVGASPLGLLLPLGISFYTFQSTGYLIDVYNGKTPAEKNPLRFLLFVSFFPQILQGPIGRYDALNPQLAEAHDFDIDQLDRATLLILYGLFKKMIIADRVLPLVNAAFAGPQGGAVALVGVLAYSLQQYCDFSGGIDLVSGIAELYGIRLAPNFRQPYFSVSLADFWRRWHISLGAWMRDYVFYPFALTSPMQKLGKASKARFGKAFARAVPAAVGNLLVQNLLLMFLPIVIGIGVRHWWPRAASKIERVLSRLAFPALILLAGIFFIQHSRTIADNIGVVGVCVTALLLCATAGAALLSRLFRLAGRQRRTVVIEVGMQNAAQAIAVASSPFIFNNDAIAVPAIIYALMMNVVLLVYVAVLRRKTPQ